MVGIALDLFDRIFKENISRDDLECQMLQTDSIYVASFYLQFSLISSVDNFCTRLATCNSFKQGNIFVNEVSSLTVVSFNPKD